MKVIAAKILFYKKIMANLYHVPNKGLSKWYDQITLMQITIVNGS